MKKALIGGDFHLRPKGLSGRYKHDPGALKIFRKIAEIEQPDVIVINGDLVELEVVSSYRDFEQSPLSESFKLVRQTLGHFSKFKVEYLAGNHEFRFDRWLIDKAEELYEVAKSDGYDLYDKLIGLSERGISYHGYNGQMQPSLNLGSLRVYHGDIIRAYGGYTAKAVLDRTGSSALINHTHRLGSNFQTKGFPDRYTTHAVWENGCLCRLDESFGGRATLLDCQQGCSVVYYEPVENGTFHVVPVPIINGRAMLNGKLYKS